MEKLCVFPPVGFIVLLVSFSFCSDLLLRHSETGLDIQEGIISEQCLIIITIQFWLFAAMLCKLRLFDAFLLAFLIMVDYKCFSSGASLQGVMVLSWGIFFGKTASIAIKNFAGGNDQRGRLQDMLLLNAMSGIFWVIVVFACFGPVRSSPLGNGFRWSGLCDNPNAFGLIVAVGIVVGCALCLDDGFCPGVLRRNHGRENLTTWAYVGGAILLIFCLVMSFSRGALVAAACGLLALSRKCFSKRSILFILLGFAAALIVIGSFWGRVPANAPGFLKRIDFSRPSVQHRVVGWVAGIKMMKDNPLGVGLNNAVKCYSLKYNAPPGGANALVTNDFLIIGVEMGIPALLCIMTYITFSLLPDRKQQSNCNMLGAGCRACGLACMVAFICDGGLFDLTTTTIFWLFMELGSSTFATGTRPGCRVSS